MSQGRYSLRLSQTEVCDSLVWLGLAGGQAVVTVSPGRIMYFLPFSSKKTSVKVGL